MSAQPDPDLYRPNVGLALFHATGLVLIARRIGAQAPFLWQMPQGGVDHGEAPQDAAFRELEEEIGVQARHVDLLEETPDWLFYEFPEGLRAESGPKGRFRGQRQKWFAFRFRGRDADIRLDTHTPEFTDWRWARLEEAPQLIVPFKRPVYDVVVQRFARYAKGV